VQVWWWSTPTTALVLQYYTHGTLHQLLQRDSMAVPWGYRYHLAHDIAQGMRYLHSRPVEAIVHGDLKSSNLLIDADGRVSAAALWIPVQHARVFV
jgi:serine/threonine protein kinase